jgi:hypothetical protein
MAAPLVELLVGLKADSWAERMVAWMAGWLAEMMVE